MSYSSSLLACYSKACLVFDIHLRHHLLRATWMLWAKKFDKRPSSKICVGLVCIVHQTLLTESLSSQQHWTVRRCGRFGDL